jgi:hypothetical protein
MAHDKPELWEQVKKKYLEGDKGGRKGQWSARKAQLAVLEYQKLSGGYVGPKDKAAKDLVDWTKQDWRTKSGGRSLDTGERYLPSKAIAALSDKQYKETSRVKRLGMKKGQQYVRQPGMIAEFVKEFR